MLWMTETGMDVCRAHPTPELTYAAAKTGSGIDACLGQPALELTHAGCQATLELTYVGLSRLWNGRMLRLPNREQTHATTARIRNGRMPLCNERNGFVSDHVMSL